VTGPLVATKVERNFGGVQALRGLSLMLQEGQILGLIGPNGSGKTTLLNVLSGTLRPTSGTVFLGPERIDRWPTSRIVAAGVAKTHQIPRPFSTMTTLENVTVAAMYGRGTRRRRADARDEAARVLGMVGLERRRDVLASALTVQEKKTLEFGRAIATGARFVLLDEIFAGLSPDELRSAMNVFSAVQKELGFGALIVEHVMQAVLTLAERVVVIEEGRKIAEGPAREIVTDPAVIEAYLGPEVYLAPS
jgi:ABC-type branched-subunit amino acid transport system ATPase component